ncbi:hypothetical protein QZH41_008069 [Actinostola sp. cb2023]|nr:hypothetical protein QZH41_008069 [Actinostola sp. cb2023]
MVWTELDKLVPAPDTATAADYNISTFLQATFATNDKIKTVSIPIKDDSLIEGVERFNLTLDPGSSTNVLLGDPKTAVITIINNDDTFYLVNVGSISIDENMKSGVVLVTIRRRGKTWVSSTVRREIEYITASPEDCTADQNVNITFKAGQTSKSITVCNIVNDKLVEDDETFKVKIHGVGGSNVQAGKDVKEIILISDDVDIACKGFRLNENDENATIVFNRTGAIAVTANSIHEKPSSSRLLECLSSHNTENRSNGTKEKVFERKNQDVGDPSLVEPIDENDDGQSAMNHGVPYPVERSLSLAVLYFFVRVQTVDGTAYDKADFAPIDKRKFYFSPGQEYLTFTDGIVDDNVEEKDENFNITLGAYPPMSNYPTFVVKEHCSTVLIKDDDTDVEYGWESGVWIDYSQNGGQRHACFFFFPGKVHFRDLSEISTGRGGGYKMGEGH